MSDSQGFLGQSPDFWRNVANFGANLSTAANARNGQGFLTYGQGFAGPLGAATLANQQFQIQQPFLGAELQKAQLANQGASIQNQLQAMQLPFMRARLDALQSYFNGNGNQQSAGMPDTTSAFAAPPTLSSGIASVESSGDPSKVNEQGYAGKYQFGAARLHDLGVYQPAPGEDLSKNEWKGTFQVPGQPWQQTNLAGFLGNPRMQDAAFGLQQQSLEKEITTRGLDKYVGQEIGGVQITPQTLMAAMHFAGPSGTQQWLETGKSPADANGITIPGYIGRVMSSAASQAYTPDQLRALASQASQKAAYAKMLGVEDPTVYEDQARLYLQAALQAQQPFEVRSGGLHWDPVHGYVKGAERTHGETPSGEQYLAYTTPPVIANGQMVSPSETVIPQAPGAPAGTPFTTEIGPQKEEFLKGRGKGFGEQFNQIDEAAAAAKDSNYMFDNMRRESQSWDMGKFADIEGDARGYLQGFAQIFGIKTPELDKKLADYQAFIKSSGQLLRDAVKSVSSRAAVQEYKLIGETLPQPTTSREGFGMVADQWQALNDLAVAKQRFAHQFQGNPQDFNVAFNSTMSPTAFLLNRMAQTPDGQRQMQAMVANMQGSPEGRSLLQRMMRQYGYAKANGYFDNIDYGEQPALPAPAIVPAPAQKPY